MWYDRQNFDSEYLCPTCGELLYVDSTGTTNVVCLIEGCRNWSADLRSIVNITESEEPQLYEELREEEARVKAELNQWKPGAVARSVYNFRKEQITNIFSGGAMPSD